MRNPDHPIDQKAGPMADRRTRRTRSRAEVERAAIDEQLPNGWFTDDEDADMWLNDDDDDDDYDGPEPIYDGDEPLSVLYRSDRNGFDPVW